MPGRGGAQATRKWGTVSALDIAGDVRGRPVVIIDDMITTGATIEAAVGLLRSRGAAPDIVVAATHGLFVHATVSRLRDLDLGRVLVTDTVAPKEAGTVIEVCSIAPTLAMAIACMHNDKPVAPITGHRTTIGRGPMIRGPRSVGR